MTGYARDPYWLTAKFTSSCKGCNATVNRGDRAFYYPNTRSIYGDQCGCAATQSADFDSHAFDESQYSGSY